MGVADFFGQFLVEGLCSGVLGEEGDENEEDSLHDMTGYRAGLGWQDLKVL